MLHTWFVELPTSGLSADQYVVFSVFMIITPDVTFADCKNSLQLLHPVMKWDYMSKPSNKAIVSSLGV
jgi:hypothetical protein